jgi:hypothetical protein
LAIRAVTAPKLHTTPAPSAIADAPIGMRVTCGAVVAVAVIE